MQLCDAFDLPIAVRCATRPGIMVGPEAEKTALVRHCSRHVRDRREPDACRSSPIVLRKGYGLGAQAMAGGSFHAPLFTVAWPTGEFGGMGLEGAVKLGFRKELEAIADPRERAGALRRDGRRAPTSTARRSTSATYFEIDDVIDPADTRALDRRRAARRAAAGAAHGQEAAAASTPGDPAQPRLSSEADFARKRGRVSSTSAGITASVASELVVIISAT